MEAQLMIEENTAYAYILRAVGEPTFENVRQLSVDFVSRLKEEDKAEIYKHLDNGRSVLDSEALLLYYLYSYGKMHLAKLRYIYSSLPSSFWNDKVDLIAWGCGQGLEIMAYGDYLRSEGLHSNLSSITLIEPSELALRRAALHARLFFPDTEIRTVCKYAGDLTVEDFPEKRVSFHIFSNFLDIEGLDLPRLVGLVKSIQRGGDYYACVSPIYDSCGGGHVCKHTCRLSHFTKELGAEILNHWCNRELKYDGDKVCTINSQLLFRQTLSEEILRQIKKAEEGDAEAQFAMGANYGNGNEVAIDYREAVKWYRMAVEQGHASAQNNLGIMYEYGRSVDVNVDEAARLYRLSADQGNSYAWGNLADMYENGKGVKKDMEEAIRLYKLSAAQGYTFAQDALKRLGEEQEE